MMTSEDAQGTVYCKAVNPASGRQCALPEGHAGNHQHPSSMGDEAMMMWSDPIAVFKFKE